MGVWVKVIYYDLHFGCLYIEKVPFLGSIFTNLMFRFMK